jgi:hypothetical protein
MAADTPVGIATPPGAKRSPGRRAGSPADVQRKLPGEPVTPPAVWALVWSKQS